MWLRQVGAERVEGGAGAMGRLGMVGFSGGCKKEVSECCCHSQRQLKVGETIPGGRGESQLGPEV